MGHFSLANVMQRVATPGTNLRPRLKRRLRWLASTAFFELGGIGTLRRHAPKDPPAGPSQPRATAGITGHCANGKDPEARDGDDQAVPIQLGMVEGTRSLEPGGKETEGRQGRRGQVLERPP